MTKLVRGKGLTATFTAQEGVYIRLREAEPTSFEFNLVLMVMFGSVDDDDGGEFDDVDGDDENVLVITIMMAMMV